MFDVLTKKQRAAWTLRRQGLKDEQIADRLGLEHRESANRLVNRAERKMREFLIACPGTPCGILSLPAVAAS